MGMQVFGGILNHYNVFPIGVHQKGSSYRPQQCLLSNLSSSHFRFHADFNTTVIPKVGRAQNKGQNHFRASFSQEYLSSRHVMDVLVARYAPLPPSVFVLVDAACTRLFSLSQEIDRHGGGEQKDLILQE